MTDLGLNVLPGSDLSHLNIIGPDLIHFHFRLNQRCDVKQADACYELTLLGITKSLSPVFIDPDSTCEIGNNYPNDENWCFLSNWVVMDGTLASPFL